MDEIIKTNSSLNNLDTIDGMIAFGERLVKSGLTPMKKAEDVMAAILMGKELGFKEMVAVNNIYSINGRASVGIHIITGLLLKAGIIYESLEDYVPLYRYKDKSGKVFTTDTLSEAIKEDIIVKEDKPYDVRTTFRFKRKVKQPDGTYEPFVVTQTFSWSDATAMGFTSKENWTKMPKIMLKTRCLTIGARLIAPDILLGMYEHTELGDMRNIKTSIDSQGNSSVIEEGIAIEIKDNNPLNSSEVPTTNKDIIKTGTQNINNLKK